MSGTGHSHKNAISNYRVYGKPPFNVALIHGGPGGAGTLKELAQLLAPDYGILEPLQTQDSLAGQLEELRKTLEQQANLPAILIGHSWGAMLGFILASRYPAYVKKLIMVSSGLFDPLYAKNITTTRLNRMSEIEQHEYHELVAKLQENPHDCDALFYQLGRLMDRVDAYDPIEANEIEMVKNQFHIYQHVWPQVAKLRETGELLKLGKNIKCPVIAIHGDYDSHPYQGVKEPLTTVLDNFTFILLDHCGHEPWIERQAKDSFLRLIRIYLEE